MAGFLAGLFNLCSARNYAGGPIQAGIIAVAGSLVWVKRPAPAFGAFFSTPDDLTNQVPDHIATKEAEPWQA
jgi:hypothetical protein